MLLENHQSLLLQSHIWTSVSLQRTVLALMVFRWWTLPIPIKNDNCAASTFTFHVSWTLMQNINKPSMFHPLHMTKQRSAINNETEMARCVWLLYLSGHARELQACLAFSWNRYRTAVSSAVKN